MITGHLYDDAMIRSMALGRCPYADGAHEFVRDVCRLCLEERSALALRAERGRLFEVNRAPKRIQRKRTKGWRMPDGAVYVGRPTVFGNPFHPPSDVRTRPRPSDRLRRVENFRTWATGSGRSPWFGRESAEARSQLFRALPELRGRDLACWCPLDQPCHADVLLELANR